MSDVTDDSLSDVAIDEKRAQKKRDIARLKTVAFQHGGAATAILGIWLVLAQISESSTGLVLQLVSVGAGFFGGGLLAFLMHEWGHFSGVRLSGAVSPVLKERRSFFMFNFKTAENSRAQFLAMSIGGPLGNWLLVLLVLMLLPWGTLAHAALLATVVGVAINVCVFEFPVIARVSRGEDPAETVAQRLKETGEPGLLKNMGLLVGLGLFLLGALF